MALSAENVLEYPGKAPAYEEKAGYAYKAFELARKPDIYRDDPLAADLLHEIRLKSQEEEAQKTVPAPENNNKPDAKTCGGCLKPQAQCKCTEEEAEDVSSPIVAEKSAAGEAGDAVKDFELEARTSLYDWIGNLIKAGNYPDAVNRLELAMENAKNTEMAAIVEIARDVYQIMLKDAPDQANLLGSILLDYGIDVHEAAPVMDGPAPQP
ncbi:MAG: hypothetical protein DHS20C02_13050 [Micavibrio sp.]|nr:MAG: hypothetical protein DHS20C02_13050 [Micavibrio sp.]